MSQDEDEPETQVVRRPGFAERLPLVVFPQGSDPLSDKSLNAVNACGERYLSRLGCILFRGFGVERSEDFLRLARGFGHPVRSIDDHAAGAPLGRSSLFSGAGADSGLTQATTRYPGDPSIHWLLCADPERVAQHDRLFADTRELFQLLPTHVRLRFAARQLCYRRLLHLDGPQSWPTLFGSVRRESVEQACAQLGFSCSWQTNGALCVWRESKAIVRHSVSGEELWSNDLLRLAILHSLPPFRPAQPVPVVDSDAIQITYADGAAIEPSIYEELRIAFDAAASVIHWEPGDVLAIDGEIGWHARVSALG